MHLLYKKIALFKKFFIICKKGKYFKVYQFDWFSHSGILLIHRTKLFFKKLLDCNNNCLFS